MNEFKNIHILGIGLIGGSLSRDLKRILPESVLYGVDSNEDHLDEAIGLGVIDHSSRFEAINQADLVILAIPVDQANLFLPPILDALKEDALVIDVGSTKGSVCDAVKEHPRRDQFLAAHPIAGTEFSGPSAAIEHLFKNKTMILCEVEKTRHDLLDKALQIFEALEMKIRYMNPHSHDKHIAYVSHLSHISSFMLGKTVIEKEKNEKDIFDMAGSGFASTVRLAKSNPATWTPIFKENKANVLESLSEYITNLTHFKNVLEAGDYEEVYNEMHNTNHIKSILKGLS
ncbi:prephenate dehydrogenase [Leeuwenhoekiella parthenopeia]|uniref:Prephenate dehydrogenase n=1 Tax=Leeuwenhoekiella parthenopeia TaxID=2890320 RepID=A0ABS8GVU6_9FLAO|nr:prephenate dehydrogenase [Leeuwenhoekiella parthenopeia]